VTVRTRLTGTVLTVALLAVAVFGTVSFVAIDRTLRSSFHAQLRTLVTAVASAVDVNDKGHVGLDRHDLEQISTIHAGLPFALYDRHGVRVVGDLLPPPSQRMGLAVVTASVVRGGVAYGTVAAWESDAWIGAFDRAMALAILAAGGALVTLGVLLSRRTADTFDEMLARIEAAYLREKRFAADASHELRTPLAVIKAESDLALRRPRDAGEYRAAIESIAREAERLEEVTDQLLAAARSYVESHDVGTIDLGDLAAEIVERVRPAAEVRDVGIRIAADGVALARANWPTVERALLAVVHNAILHAPKAGSVELRIEQAPKEVCIRVADDGAGFSAEALANATERFWRGDAARSRGGTGLGLAIARSMAEANGGSIRLANRQEGGALVTLTLPRADA
jgi:signal transduction histidine kinase